MRVDDFDFDLPSRFIAQRPATPRDSARMLCVGANANISDCKISDLPSVLGPGDILVFNDTRVIPARLKGKRGTAGVEVTLHKRQSDVCWLAFARPAKKLKCGDRIDFAPGFWAEVSGKGDGGEVTLSFGDLDGPGLSRALRQYGTMPLPPYVKRKEAADKDDNTDYQTMFAVNEGAVAAPTAGLHFTPRLMAALKDRGVLNTCVTLHVGAGTFLPVKVDRIDDHKMHSEFGVISKQAADAINTVRDNGGRIVAVGTTSLRLLETAAQNDGTILPWQGDTDIFITPGYRFRIVDRLLTNFHLPRSTLLMLIAAFAGLDTIKEAYRHAMDQDYRFYSYGDCCLLDRATMP